MNKILTLTLVCMLSFTANADEQGNTSKICEKMKSCMLEEMAGEDDLPPQMMEMMEGMIDLKCSAISSYHDQFISVSGLADKAQECIDSMVSRTCDVLMDDQDTPECTAFEKAAEQAGIAFD